MLSAKSDYNVGSGQWPSDTTVITPVRTLLVVFYTNVNASIR